ncbi:hypothetical protein GCM10011349_45630 [Novosphingobium indicum]|uniref:Uncharacterized protein n=1 Tax=Novosphingobium indicum TaxID=462949 RepID=A0ABQ2JZQ6_9SPHN|nr:hypothetical protein GCM10011349_45630 [Novosphingobium indicum]
MIALPLRLLGGLVGRLCFGEGWELSSLDAVSAGYESIAFGLSGLHLNGFAIGPARDSALQILCVKVSNFEW